MTEKLVSVMVIGSGGREHALVDAYLRSPHVDQVIAVPGNDFMAVGYPKDKIKFYRSYDSSGRLVINIKDILKICEEENVTLVDVAQENALALGVVNRIREKKRLASGPTKAAAEIEWSKLFARGQGEMVDMPQPRYEVFLTETAGQRYIDEQPSGRWFIKYDGLAEGKAALPAKNKKKAKLKISQMVREFGIPYLIEEWLENDDGTDGEEFSSFALFAGNSYEYIGDAQDHKRVFEHDASDEGDNTGGMGCSGRPLVLTDKIRASIKEEIFDKIPSLFSETISYTGILYLGGMLVKEDGRLRPKVVEFNARWGDPEAQNILPSITNDWFEVSMGSAEGNIKNLNIQRDNLYRVVVAGVSKGYPGNYDQARWRKISGLDEVRKLDNVRVYGAGIRVLDNQYYANGGRLFYIVGEGKDVTTAVNKAYDAMDRVSVLGDNLHFRKDIGYRDINRLTKAIP